MDTSYKEEAQPRLLFLLEIGHRKSLKEALRASSSFSKKEGGAFSPSFSNFPKDSSSS